MARITKLTLSEAAPQLGISLHGLQSGLERLGIKTGRGKKYTLKQLHTAAVGDFKFERTRSERAKADLLELERREKEGEIISMDDAKSLNSKITQSARNLLIKLPSIAPRCNPTDPQFARVALEQFRDEGIKQLRDEI